MNIFGSLNTNGTEIVGNNGFFSFERINRDGYKDIIIHIPDEWKPETFKSMFGNTILSVNLKGEVWKFESGIAGKRVGETIAPFIYPCHYIQWEYDNDYGYYPEYKRRD